MVADCGAREPGLPYSRPVSDTDVISLGLLLVTAIGVVVTVWQSHEARQARDESRAARDEASKYKESAAAAAFRSAKALERQADLAGLALAEEATANRSEQEARTRLGRVAFASAADGYLSDWRPRWFIGERIEDDGAKTALRRTATSVSADAERVADWILTDLSLAVNRVIDEHKTWNSREGEAVLQLAVLGLRSQATRRLNDWVSTGRFDRSPLISRAPTLPPVGDLTV